MLVYLSVLTFALVPWLPISCWWAPVQTAWYFVFVCKTEMLESHCLWNFVLRLASCKSCWRQLSRNLHQTPSVFVMNLDWNLLAGNAERGSLCSLIALSSHSHAICICIMLRLCLKLVEGCGQGQALGLANIHDGLWKRVILCVCGKIHNMEFPIVIFFVLFWCLTCTSGFIHAKNVLCHWATSLTPLHNHL